MCGVFQLFWTVLKLSAVGVSDHVVMEDRTSHPSQLHATGLNRVPSADFEASVVNGLISVSALDMTDQVSSLRSMTGRLGDGEGTIDLSIVNGDITVTGH